MNPITSDEVKDYITTLKNRKSSGPNSIPNAILKYAKSKLSMPLSHIFNISFFTGTFPEILKNAEVIPVHTKGDKTDPSNYRPISLLSNISKLIEKIIRNRLYKFLEQRNLIYQFQFGFRNGHSTNHVFLKLIETVQKVVDEKGFACSVFIDLKKAFDMNSES